MTGKKPDVDRASVPLSVHRMAEHLRGPAPGTPGGANGHPRRMAPPPPIAAAPTPVGVGPDPAPKDPVLVVRPTGEILFANRALGDVAAEDIVGGSLFDWIPLQQQALIEECLEQVFANSTAQRCELAGLRSHAPDAWYDCRLTPNVRDGSVVSVTLVAHDITEYKNTTFQLESTCRDLQRILEERTADLERASRAVEVESAVATDDARRNARFREVLDHGGEAIFVLDADSTRVVDVNDTAAHWLRRPRQEILGLTAAALHLEFPILPPPAPTLEFTETRDSRRPMLLSGLHRRRDGSTFPVEVAVATHLRERERLVLAVARDVKGRTAQEERLRESEERYATLLEQCWDAIYLSDRGGRIERVNAAAVELFGYAPAEFVGRDGRELFADPKDIQRFQVQMSAVGAVSDLEVMLVDRRGDRFPAILSATRRRTADGTITGYQCIVRPLDIRTGVTQRCVIASGVDASMAASGPALSAAGMEIVTVDSLQAASTAARQRGAAVAGIVAAADIPNLRPLVEALRREAPGIPIILVTGTDPVSIAEQVADLGVSAILPDPVHPLTLLQRLREP